MNTKLRVAVLGCLALAWSSVVLGQQTDARLIRVTGTAEIRVVPDEAVLSFAVKTSAKTIAMAKADHDARAKRIMGLLQSSGVEAKDIQTSSLSMGPKYEEIKDRATLTGYEVQQALAVRIRDMKKYEGMITGLMDAGITSIQDVDFTSGQLQKHKAEANLIAVRAARDKASAMAAELGQSLARPHLITEEEIQIGSGRNQPMANYVAGYYSGLLGSGDITIATGEIVVRARVTVSFELK